MTPFARQFISDGEIALLEEVRNAVLRLPDIDLGVDEKGKPIIMSCHILARALARVFRLKFKDGYFFLQYEHSWLVTIKGNVIDAYPIAMIGGPILMDGQVCSPSRRLYVESVPVLLKRMLKTNSFHRSVRRTAKALRIAITAQSTG